jgi:hypothetical protein
MSSTVSDAYMKGALFFSQDTILSQVLPANTMYTIAHLWNIHVSYSVRPVRVTKECNVPDTQELSGFWPRQASISTSQACSAGVSEHLRIGIR